MPCCECRDAQHTSTRSVAVVIAYPDREQHLRVHAVHACRDSYFHALAHLMRLRQACCHPALVRPKGGGGGKAPTAEEVAAARELPQAMKIGLLQALLGEGAPAGCVVCEDVADDPLVAHCRHILCRYAHPLLVRTSSVAQQPIGCLPGAWCVYLCSCHLSWQVPTLCRCRRGTVTLRTWNSPRVMFSGPPVASLWFACSKSHRFPLCVRSFVCMVGCKSIFTRSHSSNGSHVACLASSS